MYDDAYDCYSDQYAAQDECSLVDTFQPPPSRKSKRLPTPVGVSKIGGNRLPQIPQSTGVNDFAQRKKLPSIVQASASSSQFYGEQATYGGYDDDAYSESNYYQSMTTTTASASIATSDFSTKYVSPYNSYSSYMPTTSTTATTTTSFTYYNNFNNQAIATTAIVSNSYSDHSYTNSFATKSSNNLQPKSVLSSILPLTTSSSSQMHNASYGYGGIGSTIQTVTTVTTTTQSSGLGINTITSKLSSIFQSKQPTAQPKTQEQQSSLKFQLPNFTAKLTTPTTTTTTTASTVHNNDYDNNYCDDAYYNSTLPATTTPVTAVTTGVDGVGGTTIASNIYNNIHQLSDNNDYSYDDKLATTTKVDYSKDDYKYNYDDFSYSENDYIATGDITNNVQNNYNNNYDDYADDGVQQTNDNVTNNKNFYCDSSSNSLLINQDKTGGMHHLNQEHVANNQLGQTTTSSNGDYGVTMTTTSASSIGK